MSCVTDNTSLESKLQPSLVFPSLSRYNDLQIRPLEPCTINDSEKELPQTDSKKDIQTCIHFASRLMKLRAELRSSSSFYVSRSHSSHGYDEYDMFDDPPLTPEDYLVSPSDMNNLAPPALSSVGRTHSLPTLFPARKIVKPFEIPRQTKREKERLSVITRTNIMLDLDREDESEIGTSWIDETTDLSDVVCANIRRRQNFHIMNDNLSLPPRQRFSTSKDQQQCASQFSPRQSDINPKLQTLRDTLDIGSHTNMVACPSTESATSLGPSTSTSNTRLDQYAQLPQQHAKQQKIQPQLLQEDKFEIQENSEKKSVSGDKRKEAVSKENFIIRDADDDDGLLVIVYQNKDDAKGLAQSLMDNIARANDTNANTSDMSLFAPKKLSDNSTDSAHDDSECTCYCTCNKRKSRSFALADSNGAGHIVESMPVLPPPPPATHAPLPAFIDKKIPTISTIIPKPSLSRDSRKSMFSLLSSDTDYDEEYDNNNNGSKNTIVLRELQKGVLINKSRATTAFLISLSPSSAAAASAASAARSKRGSKRQPYFNQFTMKKPE